MTKKLLLGVASSFLLMGAANAETITVGDTTNTPGSGPDATSPAPQFGNPGFFGAALGDTDNGSNDTSVAHRFTTAMTGITGGTLTISVNNFLAGAENDSVWAGDAATGATFFTALTRIANNIGGGSTTLTFDLASTGLLSVIQSQGYLDVLVTDDTNVNFITLDLVTDVIPVPAALPLMATALVGGAAAMRRRKKA